MGETRGSDKTGDGLRGGLAKERPEMDRSKATSSSSEERKGVAGARALRKRPAMASKTASSSVLSLLSSLQGEGGGVSTVSWADTSVSWRTSCSNSVILQLGLDGV